MERNKKKYVTSVHGLHHFGIDLKKAAKLFANKFGAGATVSKTPQGDEEILIQGDTSADVRRALSSPRLENSLRRGLAGVLSWKRRG